MTKRSKEIVYIAITAILLGEHNTSGKQKTTKKTTKKKKKPCLVLPSPSAFTSCSLSFNKKILHDQHMNVKIPP